MSRKPDPPRRVPPRPPASAAPPSAPAPEPEEEALPITEMASLLAPGQPAVAMTVALSPEELAKAQQQWQEMLDRHDAETVIAPYPVAEPPAPAIYDYVIVHGPEGVRLPGIITALDAPWPGSLCAPRCTIQTQTASGAAAFGHLPPLGTEGELWTWEWRAGFAE